MIFKNEDKKLKTRCKITETDKFWDIGEITPVEKNDKRKQSVYDTDAVLVFENNDKGIESGKFVAEKIPEYKKKSITSYCPENTLIKSVDIFSWPTKYTFYERFRNDAQRYFNLKHKEVPHVRYYSYMPSYVQMSLKQREWYFYWRDCVRNKKYLSTDSSYILLYIYEIINLPELIPAEEGIIQLIEIWGKYRKSYTKLDKYMAEWVCDYCLINNVALPREKMAAFLPGVIEEAIFKQFYVSSRSGNEYASLLLEKASTYRWRKSKYINDENREIFERHIKSAFEYCVSRYSISDGRFDSASGRLVEKKAIRDSFGGALCAYDVKRKIDVCYYDLANVGDLAFIVTDTVKHCENRIRAYLGIRARLGVQNLSEQQKIIINEYFDKYLPAKFYEKSKKEEYVYENTEEAKPFSVSFEKAKQIEQDSWMVTDRLVDEQPEEYDDAISDEYKDTEDKSIEGQSLDIAKEALLFIYRRDTKGFIELANETYMLPETLAECVNELCYEVLGDIGIEEKDGEYVVIQDYEQEIREWLKL